MLEKELEILKHISELYKEDTTDEAFLNEMQGKETIINAWKEAFDGYFLHDVLNAIDEYFSYKNNRTPPRIAQIKAILNTGGIHDDREQHQEVVEKADPSFGLKFQQQDKLEGNMHWFVPDYLEVEKLILADKWMFVHNIKKPTIDEFHCCIEYWCEETTGHKYRFYSANDIEVMSDEQKAVLFNKCQEKMSNFSIKRLN